MSDTFTAWAANGRDVVELTLPIDPSLVEQWQDDEDGESDRPA